MNDCLLESENFQITKSDNNKYLLLPVTKTQQAEKFVLKECGKDIDSLTQVLLSYFTLTHTQISSSFLPFFDFQQIKFENRKKINSKNYLSPNFLTNLTFTFIFSVSHCTSMSGSWKKFRLEARKGVYKGVGWRCLLVSFIKCELEG